MRRTVRPSSVGLAVLLLVTLMGCTEASVTTAEHSARPRQSTSDPAGSDRVPLNGRITGAQEHFGARALSYGWRSYDPVSETALFVTGPVGDTDYPLRRLVVVGATGRIATLTCGHTLPCLKDDWLSYPATLGPGPDEVTVRSGDRTARVIGYDGTVHRTLDLRSTTARGAEVMGLRWSADGSRLAVLSARADGPAGVARVWLVDRNGDGAQLAYSLSAPGKPKATGGAIDGTGYFWPATGWGWSPDGQTLLLEVRTRNSLHGADVVVLRLQPDGATRPVIARTLYHSNRHFDSAGNVAWSPDGTRIAVRTRKHVNEISAEDGRVLVRHPDVEGWLIWPAKVRWPGPVRPGTGQPILSTAQAKGWADPDDVDVAAIDVRAVVDARTSSRPRHPSAFSQAGAWRFDTARPTPRWHELVRTGRVYQYGVVVDGDGNGDADCEIGFDNDTTIPGETRTWVTNLRTGVRVEWRTDGPPIAYGTSGEMGYPTSRTTTMSFRGKEPEPCDRFGATAAYYVWTSASVDGEVTAWDYAPNAAWLPMPCDEECLEAPSAKDRRR